MLAHTLNALLNDPVLTSRMTMPQEWKFTRPMFWLLLPFIGLILAFAAVAFWFEKHQRQSRSVAQRTAAFPTTHMPLRLGAPYSGGKGASLGE